MDYHLADQANDTSYLRFSLRARQGRPLERHTPLSRFFYEARRQLDGTEIYNGVAMMFKIGLFLFEDLQIFILQ